MSLKYKNAPKVVLVYNPEYFLRQLQNGTFEPRLELIKREKDSELEGQSTVLSFSAKVYDTNLTTTKPIVFSFPSSENGSVVLRDSDFNEGEHIAFWDSAPEPGSYKFFVNEIVKIFLNSLHASQTALSHPETPIDIVQLDQLTKLRWNWPKKSIESYFDEFNPELHTHQVSLGSVYYSHERNAIGPSLQLNTISGKTDKGRKDFYRSDEFKQIKKQKGKKRPIVEVNGTETETETKIDG